MSDVERRLALEARSERRPGPGLIQLDDGRTVVERIDGVRVPLTADSPLAAAGSVLTLDSDRVARFLPAP